MKKLILMVLILGMTACTSQRVSIPATATNSQSTVAPIGALDTEGKTLDDTVIFSKQIYFEPGSAKITSESRKVLNGLMAMMQLEPSYRVHIIGLADETEKKPIQLSFHRATSVAQLFQSAGIESSRLSLNGQGRDLNLQCRKLREFQKAACLQNERTVILTNRY